MAKLKAPLMSLGASGKLAGALVYFPWKGLNVVREYVIPSNPKTALQVTQRGYVTTMVAAIHTAEADATDPLGSVDQSAYSALASAKGRIMTWFNMAVKLGVDALRLGDGYTVYSHGRTDLTGASAITVEVSINDNGVLQVADGKFFFGTSKTNLINSHVAVVGAGATAYISAADLSAFITAGTKYYWQFRPDAADPCEGSDSGIYYFVAT